MVKRFKNLGTRKGTSLTFGSIKQQQTMIFCLLKLAILNSLHFYLTQTRIYFGLTNLKDGSFYANTCILGVQKQAIWNVNTVLNRSISVRYSLTSAQEIQKPCKHKISINVRDSYSRIHYITVRPVQNKMGWMLILLQKRLIL